MVNRIKTSGKTTTRPTSENRSFQRSGDSHSDAHAVTNCKDQCPQSLLASRKRGSYQRDQNAYDLRNGCTMWTLELRYQRPGTAFVRGQTSG
ncbi:hypothetical protein TNCV_519841 [Trichonephila clavipes]|nr:hypothetical protein TNCV_519841 [Trichonephila clavipes]